MNPQEQSFDETDFDALFRDSRQLQEHESELYGPDFLVNQPFPDSTYPPHTMSTEVLSMPPWQPAFVPPPLLNTQIDPYLPDDMSPQSAFSNTSFIDDQGGAQDNASTSTMRAKRTRKKSAVDVPERSAASTSKAGNRRTSTAGEDESKGRQALLERNRVAASKCRERKKVANTELEEKSRVMGAENAYLKATEAALRHELLELKYQCLEHTSCNCYEIRDFMKRQAMHHSPPMSAVSGYGAEEALLQASETPPSNLTTDGTETESTPNSSNFYSPPTADNRSNSDRPTEKTTSSHHP